MLDLPWYITLTFILATFFAFLLSALSVLLSGRKRLSSKANILSVLLLLWLIFQSTLSLSGWYMFREANPPHILFPVLINVGLFALGLSTPLGKKFMDSLPLRWLMWIFVLRVPVEVCLYWLAQHKQSPWSITFMGENFDIVFGLTAPIFILWYLYRPTSSRKLFLVWNILGLVSVIYLMVRVLGSVPTVMQAWDFSQPNYSVLHFPFIWLIAFLLPLQLFTHIVVVRRLLASR